MSCAVVCRLQPRFEVGGRRDAVSGGQTMARKKNTRSFQPLLYFFFFFYSCPSREVDMVESSDCLAQKKKLEAQGSYANLHLAWVCELKV